MLTIGELARRVGVTPRALRHYDSIGLLAPAGVDERTGYRSYDAAQVVRAVQIEQLKAAGLRLGEIAALLDGDHSHDVLEQRRAELRADIAERRRALRLLDALLETGTVLGAPRIVTVPATPVITETSVATPSTLTPVIRRGVQRLRRRVRAGDPSATWVFGARFSTAQSERLDVEVVATHPGLAPDAGSWPATEAVTVDVVGPHDLLPAVYDAGLAVAAAQRRRVVGTVRETYLQLGPVPRTTVAIPLAVGPAPGSVSP